MKMSRQKLSACRTVSDLNTQTLCLARDTIIDRAMREEPEWEPHIRGEMCRNCSHGEEKRGEAEGCKGGRERDAGL